MKRTKIPELAEIAAGQWGMVTSRQAAAVGVDARTLVRLAEIGELERLAHGIYRLAGAPPSQHDDLRVVWLSLDPRRTAYERISSGPIEVVSHRSAAVLLGLGDLDADVLEFSVPSRRQTRRPDVVIHLVEVPEEDWQMVDGLPVTTPLRTISDLAGAHIDQGHLASAVRDAIAQHHVPVGLIELVLSPWARSYAVTAGRGDQLLDRLLNQAGIPRSALELSAHADPAARRFLVERLNHVAGLDAGTNPEVKTRVADVLVDYLVQELEHRNDDVPVELRARYAAALASAATTSPSAATALRQLMSALYPTEEPKTTDGDRD
jgi:hypothetical protein